MLKRLLVCVLICCSCLLYTSSSQAQCSICTKTAQQLGEKPAKALNGGILYLAAAPLLMMGFIGYRWWKNNR